MRYSVRNPLVATGLVVLLGVVMTMLDTTIVNVAIGTLARDFGATLATMQWAVTGYLLALSMTVPLTGWAMGRFGSRNVWVVALALFVAGSALCAAAWSAAWSPSAPCRGWAGACSCRWGRRCWRGRRAGSGWAARWR